MRPKRMVLAGLLGAACAAPLAVSGPPVASTIPEGLDAYRPIPEDNALTVAKVALGRRLFFDPLLSADRSMSCATCHDPERAFTDGRPMSVGVYGRRGRRNVPTLVNRAYGRSFFWDGRTNTLEEQVLRPIQDSLEMAVSLDEAIQRLTSHAEYPTRFREVFGRDPNVADLGAALASYVRTILAGGTSYDHAARGDPTAASPGVLRGLQVFRRSGCPSCHVGPNFTDEQFHNTGVAWRDGALTDPGRFTVTGRPEDRGAFKTPTLREVARTAPYMHDGSLASLEDVVAFYDEGGRLNPYLDPLISPLDLDDEEREALLTFLRSLSGDLVEGVP